MRPSDAELEILNLLWEHGPATVREVHASVVHSRDIGYTTTLKTMQIMDEKGLVMRDTRRRPHVYAARVRQGDVQRSLLGRLADRAFGGSVSRLVARAIEEAPPSPEDLADLRAMLDRLARGED